MPTSTSELVDAIDRLRLLDPAQLAALTGDLQVRLPDARALSQEMIRRGWLTPYQINRLVHGRGQDLVLGSYQLLERLGEGGMGQVFKARHARLGRIVALKDIRKERLANNEAVRRFRREIQAVAQLNHPNIVLAYDADEAAGHHFYAMEYVEGSDLSRLIKTNGRLAISQACDFVRQAALGLQHAHERGLVHRDIKPSNLMLSNQGVLKVLDMGLARLTRALEDGTGATTLTHENSVMGTPDYVAPEQILHAHTVDIRADLYSLGCTLYYLLTGQVPFPGTSLGEKLVKHQLLEPVPLETARPEVPSAAAAIVRKLMAKRPEDRFQTPGELALALGSIPPGPAETFRPAVAGFFRASSEPPLATPVPGDTLEGVSRLTQVQPVRKKKWTFVAVATGCFVVLGVGILSAIFWTRPGDSPNKQVVTATTRVEGPKTFTNSLGMKLIQIPAGKFLMGSPETELGREPHEGPQHEVAITRPFFMGTTEVTLGQFRAFVTSTGYQTDGEREQTGSFCYTPTGETVQDAKVTWQNPGWVQGTDHPVVCVSRNDVLAFTNWLGQKERRTYRLPTEAEWEYACRAGTSTPFNCGKTLSAAQARFGNAMIPETRKTAAGGSYAPNAFGLHDMHGGVWEWVADWYDPNYYRQSPPRDPPGPATGSLAILRGGGYEVIEERCRSAFRLPMAPSFRHVVIGFRVVSEE